MSLQIEKTEDNRFSISKLLQKREAGIFIGLAGLTILFSIIIPSFLSVKNILNITRQVSIIAILSTGMSLAIISGGIDLSVGSVVAFVGVIVADLMVTYSLPVYIAILVGLLIGAILGAVNGFFIAYIKIPPFIATLGTMTAVRGLTYVYTQGYPIYGLPHAFGNLGAGYILGIPVPTIIMFLIVIITYLLLRKLTLGRSIYAMGGNELAAKLSGIPVDKRKLIVYTIVGGITALSGIILAARLRAGLPTAGQGYELTAIAAVILGGASINGGEGSVLGAIMGALLLGILENGLNLLNINSYILQVITGAVIIFAVFIDRINNKEIFLFN